MNSIQRVVFWYSLSNEKLYGHGKAMDEGLARVWCSHSSTKDLVHIPLTEGQLEIELCKRGVSPLDARAAAQEAFAINSSAWSLP